jgi:hypothetical protein
MNHQNGSVLNASLGTASLARSWVTDIKPAPNTNSHNLMTHWPKTLSGRQRKAVQDVGKESRKKKDARI